MKVVLDTNVFISGIFFAGPPSSILRAWREGFLQLIISPKILEEYQRVGEALAKQFTAIDLRPIIDLVTVKAETYEVECFAHDPNQDLSYCISAHTLLTSHDCV